MRDDGRGCRKGMMEAWSGDGGLEVRRAAAEPSDKATGSTNKPTQAAAEGENKTDIYRRDGRRKWEWNGKAVAEERRLIQRDINEQVGRRWCIRGGSNPSSRLWRVTVGRLPSIHHDAIVIMIELPGAGSPPAGDGLQVAEVTALCCPLTFPRGSAASQTWLAWWNSRPLVWSFTPFFGHVNWENFHTNRGSKNIVKTSDKTENASANHSCSFDDYLKTHQCAFCCSLQLSPTVLRLSIGSSPCCFRTKLLTETNNNHPPDCSRAQALLWRPAVNLSFTSWNKFWEL